MYVRRTAFVWDDMKQKESQLFVQMDPVQVIDGHIELRVRPDELWTLSTYSPGTKVGMHVVSPFAGQHVTACVVVGRLHRTARNAKCWHDNTLSADIQRQL